MQVYYNGTGVRNIFPYKREKTEKQRSIERKSLQGKDRVGTMDAVHEIPNRSEADQRYTWATEDLYKTEEEWFADLSVCGEYPKKIAAYRGTLGTGAKQLLSFCRLSDELGLLIERVAKYIYLRVDEDQANSHFLDMRGKCLKLEVELESESAFAATEILAIPEETLCRFYEEEPELNIYRRQMEQIRRNKEHILSDAEEKLLASAGEIAGSPDRIGCAFRNADLRFPDVTDEKGQTYPLTQGSFIPLLQSEDRSLREKTFKAFYGQFDCYKNTVASILEAQIKQLSFFAKARRYPSTLEAALDRTEVPVSVYNQLIDTVHAHMDIMYRYVRLRKKLLGGDQLHMYDLYTSIVPGAERKITFEEAKKTVLEGLKPMGEDYLAVVREAFENRWLDVYENRGKCSGAYSMGCRPHPFVLLNHKDTLDCQFTLAHEMGHAMHSYLSNRCQPFSTSQYVIFVAEVASTCNEVLLMRYLLGKTTERRERAYLINYFLEQFRTTLYRQTMFAEFEREINRMSETGEGLTADALNRVYYDLNKLYYGPDMEVDPEIALEWARIPHFFMNFYVFQYATGFSAAVALAEKILREGEPAVAAYKKFLSSGSSADPISLLKIAGVDMTTAKPVEDALQLFHSLLDEMEALSD